MLKEINEILKKNNIIPHRYENEGKITIIDTDKKRYVYKENIIDSKIENYLKSRNFNYLPNIIDNKLYIYEEEYQIPKQQKIIDLIKLTALLHNKTTHYIEIDSEYFEKIYDDIENNLKHLYSYYTDIITIIESKVFPSPSEQLISRNISKIYDTITNTKKKLDKWHKAVENINKIRKVIVHNNLHISHLIRNEKSFLISWNQSKLASPIVDIYKLYINHSLDFDFEEILKIYEKNYPLLNHERELLYILISLPEKPNNIRSEYEKCKNISHILDKIYKTEKIVSPETSKNWKRKHYKNNKK